MDVVSEFATRIRNASEAKHEKFDTPNSNIRTAIAEVLKKEGYIKNFKVVKDGKQGMMRVYLKYSAKGNPVISTIRRMSRPGRRYYVASTDIPRVQSGFGISVFSTNKGVMSGEEAKLQNVGGEYLLKVW